MLKYFNVFNQSQIENIDFPNLNVNQDDRNIDIDDFINNVGIEYKNIDNTSCYYVPNSDFINMPKYEYFHQGNKYYKSLFHEIVHSTGHTERLNRKLTGHGMGNKKDYSFEELIAEIGSSFLMGIFGLSTDDQVNNSSAYIQSWISVLENNTDWIIKAAAQAQKAIDYLFEQYEINKEKNVNVA